MTAVTDRKSLSKKIRFEVFKRDSFQCQYCGRTPPQVTLETDHISPVASGGGNEIDNLVTACFDCNRGKSDRLLTSIPQTIVQKSEILEEKESQLKAYLKLVRAKQKRLEKDVDRVSEIYSIFVPGYELNDQARITVRMFIERLSALSVEDAMAIAGNRWRHKDQNIFKYFCGICWNRIREIPEIGGME